MQKKIVSIFYLLLCLSFVACSSEEVSNGQLNVVATTGQIADAVANIAGESVNLTGLLGPGVDPHLYVPSEGDVATFANADVIFYNGLHLEAQMLRVLEQMADTGVTVVSVGDSVSAEKLLEWSGQATLIHDPHIWNDPMLWSEGVAIMRDTLVEASSENAELFTTNTATYLAEIAETHTYVQQQIETIPIPQRVMITAHDAFAYFGRTYNIEVLGLQGISTESEASTADINDLVTVIVERQIPAIFVESSVSPRTVEAVQAAVQAQGFDVQIGGSLYSDALGEQGNSAETYLGMLRHNADTLAAALGENP